MRWLKPREAAGYARVSVKLLYRAIGAGELQAARVGRGRNLVVSEKWVDEWLSQSAAVHARDEHSTKRKLSA